jgi:SIR2-like domain
MVILLGAGATRGAFVNDRPPPPVDSDFFDIANQISGRGTKPLARRVTGNVFALYGTVTGIGLEQYYRDIETRLELGRFAKTRNRPMDWRARTHDLEELVRRVLIHTTCQLGDGPAKARGSTIHSKILSRVRADDTIITFNYDTVIEESMPAEHSLWTPKGGYGVDVSGVTHAWARRWYADREMERTRDSKVQLLKLHGSLNWVLYKTSKVRLKPRPYVIRARNNKPVFDRAAIVPPGWHKRVDRNPYNALWREARLALENCATLIIAGYSLPETDLVARALFLEVSRVRGVRGKILKELHVADVSDLAKK